MTLNGFRLALFISFLVCQSCASKTLHEHTHWTASLEKCVRNLKTNEYAFNKAQFDCDKGVAKADCSGFFNKTLERYLPHKYSSATKLLQKTRLNTSDYFEIINRPESHLPFQKVKQIDDLQPGDFIVWKYTEKQATSSHGHILLVLDKPKQTVEKDIYLIKIIDSALSGHFNDTRKTGTSGVGIGSVFIKTDKDGQPTAYGWSSHKRLVFENPMLLGRLE
jgi:hypothetical protein